MRRTTLLSAMLLIASACAPSTGPTPTPTPVAPVSDIAFGEISPGSGATLVLRPCVVGRLCTDQLRTNFEVLVPADIPKATVLMSLFRGGVPCAWAFQSSDLRGGSRSSFSTSSIEMVYDEEGHLLCPTPAETTRLVVQVFYPNSVASAYLTRELPYRYTLATQ